MILFPVERPIGMRLKDEIIHHLVLQSVPQVGNYVARKLVAHFKSAAAVFQASPDQLSMVDGIGPIRISHLAAATDWEAAEQEYEMMVTHQVRCILYNDKEYPVLLRRCPDAPILLFYTGNIPWGNPRWISIVGARRNTEYGMAFCQDLMRAIRPWQPVIVSGLAYGTDITAHLAALHNDLPTVACLAHGFSTLYPKAHQKYRGRIEQDGGFLTEFRHHAFFHRKNFLSRNRIIAGLGQVTIVVESAKQGGSLVTARLANSYHREVMALPGRASDTQSEGCNNLIKRHQAAPITSAEDLIQLLGWDSTLQAKAQPQRTRPEGMSPTETTLWDCLASQTEMLLDDLVFSAQLGLPQVAATLLQMELKGWVKPLPGNRFGLH